MEEEEAQLWRERVSGKSLPRLGADWYPLGASVHMVAIVYVLLLYTPMTATASRAGVGEAISTSQFSGDMVLMLMLHLVIMTADRGAMLARSHAAKLALQYALVLALHLFVLVVVPLSSGTPFSDNPALWGFYVLEMVYLAVAARQVRDGFPVSLHGLEAMTQRGYSQLRYFAFKVYRAIPFAFEMRAVFDWASSRTSMDLFMWLNLEDIYGTLFACKCEMVRRVRDPHLRWGLPRPFGERFALGFLVFAALALVLVLPLLLFSSLNPAMSQNLVTDVELSVGIRRPGTAGMHKLYESPFAARVRAASADEFAAMRVFLASRSLSALQADWSNRAQVVALPRSGPTLWDATPPGVRDLMRQLEDADTALEWVFQAAFVRPQPEELKTQRLAWTHAVHPGARAALAASLNASVTPPAERVSNLTQPVVIPAALPRAVRLPGPVGALVLDQQQSHWPNVTLRLHEASESGLPAVTQRWWSLQGPPATEPSETAAGKDAGGVTFFTVSDKVVDTFISSSIGANGVTGLYLTVRAPRSACAPARGVALPTPAPVPHTSPI